MKFKSVMLVCCLIGLSFATVMLIISMSRFDSGYGMSDLGQNLRWINTNYNLNISDTLLNYDVKTPKELYIEGIKRQREAFLQFGLYCFIFGYLLGIVILSLLEEDSTNKTKPKAKCFIKKKK